MPRIIDLKNKKPQSQTTAPETGKSFAAKIQPRPVHQPVRPVTKAVEVAPKPKIETVASKESDARVFAWSGELYRQSDKRTVGIFALILFGIAALVQIFQKNVITTVFFVLLGVVLLLNANRKSKTGNFEINPIGVKIEDKLYGFRDIISFWIEYEPSLGIKELSLQLKKWYMPYIKVPIGDQSPVQIRQFLLRFIPEIEHQDTFVEILSRKLGI